MYFFLMYEILHWLWSFLLTKFMAHLASFWLKIMFVFSNTLSIVKVMPRNSNLTQFDMLTLSSSNMTAPTLKTTFEKTNKPCFLSSFCLLQLKKSFLTFSLEHNKEIISYLESTQNLCFHLHFHTVQWWARLVFTIKIEIENFENLVLILRLVSRLLKI